MKNKNKLRIIIWSILCFIVLSLGLTGLLMNSGLGFLNNWFNHNNEEPVEKYIELDKITNELNLYLENYYLNTDTIVSVTQPDENNISIVLKNGNEVKYLFTLEDKILSFNYEEANKNMGVIIFNQVVSFIQNEFFGISVEDSLATLTSVEFNSFSLETNGVESIKRNGKFYNKLDVSHQITIINTVSQAIEVSDLENIKDILINEGNYQTSKGNIILYKTNTDTEIKISIMEKNVLTDNSYKSLISTLMILLDSTKVEEFKNKYPGISINTTFDNYIIEINPELTELERSIITEDNYQLIRVTIIK